MSDKSMQSVNDIRKSFLDFYAREGHTILPSSSLVPRNDPTLMFTNSGMVPFKNYFTGVEKPPVPRATTAQKSVRAGGKHNDLDNVGYTARHHTFFEMLGNFSFGDYFKERAIDLAWRLITQEFGLAKERLLVTVYHTDDEAFNLWRKIAGLPEERIIRIATSDNFWMMGDLGPCGPCSEIFYDHGDHIPGGPPGSPEEDGDRFIEIWNLVFMQYESQPGGVRVPLPKPSIDTGMGLERVAAVLQGKHDNYDIDTMRTLIMASANATNTDPDGAQKVSHRVIADHLRASAFLIADGVLPSNEGRGYVLRRIMRRAMRHAQLLGARDPLMWRLFPALQHEMGRAYPELERAGALITETLKLEETRFRTTLARGLHLLEEETAKLGDGQALSGEAAFKLYDTYGFPLDLTQDALRSKGLGVDLNGFNSAMARQKAEARKAWSGSGDKAAETIWFTLREDIGATEFLGYETLNAQGVVKAIVVDGVAREVLKASESGQIVLNQTPFYAESGGQTGDTGMFRAAGILADVTQTLKKAGDVFVHHVTMREGALHVGTALDLAVDSARRLAIAANHSATHLLHEALRQVLGDHVAQKGSSVLPERLRFDISHPKPITDEELEKVEIIANQMVLQNGVVETRLMAIEDAMHSGARALFGEKYGDEVRVVSMAVPEGEIVGATPERFSVELCGGTHVSRLGDIGLVTIVAEQAVAAGVRRVEAKTRQEARAHLMNEAKQLRALASTLKTAPEQVASRLDALIDERKKLERDLTDVRKKLAMGGGGSGADEKSLQTISGIKFFSRIIEGVEAKDLKSLALESLSRLESGIVTLITLGEDNKASVIVAVSSDLTVRHSAVTLVRLAADILGGKGGGGKPDLAQAGGPDGDKAQEAIAAIAKQLEQDTQPA